ncbi:hypothetical protein WAI453_001684 [Rhynchosporium graminicola]
MTLTCLGIALSVQECIVGWSSAADRRADKTPRMHSRSRLAGIRRKLSLREHQEKGIGVFIPRHQPSMYRVDIGASKYASVTGLRLGSHQLRHLDQKITILSAR